MVARVYGIMKLEIVLGEWGILYEKIVFTLQKRTGINKMLVRRHQENKAKCIRS